MLFGCQSAARLLSWRSHFKTVYDCIHTTQITRNTEPRSVRSINITCLNFLTPNIYITSDNWRCSHSLHILYYTHEQSTRADFALPDTLIQSRRKKGSRNKNLWLYVNTSILSIRTAVSDKRCTTSYAKPATTYQNNMHGSMLRRMFCCWMQLTCK